MIGPAAAFPAPHPDRDTEPFWAAAAEDRLVVQHCAHCKKWIWLPTPICPSCGLDELVWEQVCGRAEVLSWMIPYPPVLPAFAEMLPFYILLVQLDEGPRMLGQLVDPEGQVLSDAGPDGLHFGAPVRLVWRTQGAQRLPSWTLGKGGGSP